MNTVKVPKSKYFDKDIKALMALYKKLIMDTGAQPALFANCGQILFEISQHSESKYSKDIYKLVEDTFMSFKGTKSFDSKNLAFNYPALLLVSNPKKWKEMLQIYHDISLSQVIEV